MNDLSPGTLVRAKYYHFNGKFELVVGEPVVADCLFIVIEEGQPYTIATLKKDAATTLFEKVRAWKAYNLETGEMDTFTENDIVEIIYE